VEKGWRVRKDGSRFRASTVLTALRDETGHLSGYQLGVNSYLHKPVDFEQSRDVVKQLGLYWLVVNQPAPAEAFSSG
jgi:DNA-binding NarL/FixJ family response regulator